MKKRCYTVTDKAYPNYGGRGITICNEWREEFLEFYKWAMSSGYKEKLSIDRIDNNGNYEPQNCRWVSDKSQNNNRRINHFIEYEGERLTLAEWETKTGIRQETIRRRLKKGWTVKDALTKK